MYPYLTSLQRRVLPVECRPLISGDIRSLVRLQRDDDVDAFDELNFRRRFGRPHWKVFVSIPTKLDHRFPQPGEPMAFLSCTFVAGITRIERISVHPWARREYVATRLWAHVLPKIPPGHETIQATVRETNLPGQQWLRSIGLVLVEVKKGAFANPDKQWERVDGYVFEGRLER